MMMHSIRPAWFHLNSPPHDKKAMNAKARATNAAPRYLAALIMLSRIAQQSQYPSCMAHAFSSLALTWSMPPPAEVMVRGSSPSACPNLSQPFGIGFPLRRRIAIRQQRTSTTNLQGMIDNEILTSPKGATVKKFKSLVSKKRKRTEESATVAEGMRAVIDLLSDEKTRDLVQHIIVEENAMPDQTMSVFADLVESCSSPPKVTFATSAVIKACSDTVTPQGIVALVSIPAPYQYNSEACVGPGTRTYLVLETSDPGNTGTLIRSAIACGVEAIIFMPGSCDAWSPKTVRSAMTANFKIPLLQVDSWDDCKERLESFGVRLELDFYAATMEGSEKSATSETDIDTGDSLPYYEVNWAGSESVAVCVGKEGPGLSQAIRNAVRVGEVRAVHVPMAEGIESLNAAVSGSVILFESARQRKAKK